MAGFWQLAVNHFLPRPVPNQRGKRGSGEVEDKKIRFRWKPDLKAGITQPQNLLDHYDTLALNIIIQLELVWMGTGVQFIELIFLFVRNIRANQVIGKHPAPGQEFMVGFQGPEGCIQ